MEASRPVQLAQFQGHQSTTAFKPKLHFSCLWFHFQSPMPHSSQSRSSRSRRNTKHTAGCRCDTSYCTVKKKKKKMPLSRETTVRFCCIGIVEVHGNGSTQPRKKKKIWSPWHPTFEKLNIRWVVCLKTTHGVAKFSARCSRRHSTNFIGGWGSRARHTSKVKINVLYESSMANTNSSRGTLVLRRRRFDHR